MKEWFEIENAAEIDSPSLLLYKERIVENIAILKKFVPDTKRIRPHVKTNKCAEVCQLMMDAGIECFKCATIAEAEMLAMLKAKDVLLAYQPIGPKVERLVHLIEAFPETQFSCLVDNAQAARFIHEVASRHHQVITVFIDLNVGMNRTGIATENAYTLFEEIQKMSGLRFRGLHAYDGHLRDSDLALRKSKCDTGFESVVRLRQQITSVLHHDIVVIAGGTPTFPIHATRTDVECSPGTFIFWDKGYQQLLAEQPFVFAALVLTRVISLPDAETITADLGHKAIASESPLSNRVYFLNAPELIPIGHSEEHLVLKAPTGHSYQVGDLLYGVPHHICPTVALYETAVVVDHQKATTNWNIVSRKRKITI